MLPLALDNVLVSEVGAWCEPEGRFFVSACVAGAGTVSCDSDESMCVVEWVEIVDMVNGDD
jgi:hypothetical protein